MNKRSEPGCDTERHALSSGPIMLRLIGTAKGPVLSLLGGIHGDEDEGVLAVRRFLKAVAGTPFKGEIRAIAPANPVAWATHSRSNPLDEQNLARCFPGDPKGGPSSRLALDITEHLIAGSDLLVDLHSAGKDYSMPLFCGYVRSGLTAEASHAAADAFGAPVQWIHESTAPGRSLSAAMELGVPAIYAECGGGSAIEASDLDAFVSGLWNVMSALGMCENGSQRPSTPVERVFGSGDLDDGAVAGKPGLFVRSVSAGQPIETGDEVGRLFDYDGEQIEIFRSARRGRIMFLRRNARVLADDILYVVGRKDGPSAFHDTINGAG